MGSKKRNATTTHIPAPRLPRALQAVIAWVAQGKPVREACAVSGVAMSTFFERVAQQPGLAEQYARAMEVRAEMLFDELLSIADRDGQAAPDDAAQVQRDRLRIDARKWALAKMLPKKYGDKLEHTAEKGSFHLTLHYDREDADA